MKGQEITYKWIGLLCNPEEHKKTEYTKKYGEYILNDSEKLSLKEIKENRNKRYIFYVEYLVIIAVLAFYNIRCHREKVLPEKEQFIYIGNFFIQIIDFIFQI